MSEAKIIRLTREYLDLGLPESEARQLATTALPQRHPLKELSLQEMLDEGDAGWLVGDNDRPVLLADALWMTYGTEKAGKTYHDLELALCVAFGFDYYGLPVRAGNVCYIIAEGGLPRIAKRIMALCEKYKEPLGKIGIHDAHAMLAAGRFNVIGSAVNLVNPKAPRGLDALLDNMGHPPYAAVWLDTWSRMLAESGGHVSDSDMVAMALRNCDRLRGILGCTVTLVAHSPLSDRDRPKGMNEQTGNLDGATLMQKKGKGRTEVFTATSEFQRHAQNGFVTVYRLQEFGPDRALISDTGQFRDTMLDQYPLALSALRILRGMPAGTEVDEWRAAVDRAGLLTAKNKRHQWADTIMQHLLATGAIIMTGTIVDPVAPMPE